MFYTFWQKYTYVYFKNDLYGFKKRVSSSEPKIPRSIKEKVLIIWLEKFIWLRKSIKLMCNMIMDIIQKHITIALFTILKTNNSRKSSILQYSQYKIEI